MFHREGMRKSCNAAASFGRFPTGSYLFLHGRQFA
jgi:hypothetical protein